MMTASETCFCMHKGLESSRVLPTVHATTTRYSWVNPTFYPPLLSEEFLRTSFFMRTIIAARNVCTVTPLDSDDLYHFGVTRTISNYSVLILLRFWYHAKMLPPSLRVIKISQSTPLTHHDCIIVSMHCWELLKMIMFSLVNLRILYWNS